MVYFKSYELNCIARLILGNERKQWNWKSREPSIDTFLRLPVVHTTAHPQELPHLGVGSQRQCLYPGTLFLGPYLTDEEQTSVPKTANQKPPPSNSFCLNQLDSVSTTWNQKVRSHTFYVFIFCFPKLFALGGQRFLSVLFTVITQVPTTMPDPQQILKNVC